MPNVIQFVVQGTDKFSGTFDKLNKSLGTTVKISSAVAGAMAAAGAALFGLTKKITSAEDRVAKFSKRLHLNVEELTALEFAGQRASIPVQQLDMSIQRLERRSAEAAQGLGEARGALKELGIDARKFTQLGIEDKMSMLAKQLEGVTDAGTRTRIAFKLFDSEGVSMLQMLGEGEEAFRSITAEARNFGAVISKQAAANAEAFQDSLTNMTTVLGSVFRGVSDELAPIFTNLMDRITGFFINNREAFIELTRNAVKAFWTIFVIGERVFEGIGKTMEQFTSWEGIKTIAENFKNAFVNIFNSSVAVFSAIGQYIVNVFKVAFETVKALGSWAWENIKSIFTDAEGPNLGELLFSRIPEATSEARAALMGSMVDIGDAVISHFTTIGSSMASIFNINLADIDERVNMLSESFKTFGTVAEESVQPLITVTETLQSRLKTLWDDFLKQQGDSFNFMVESLFQTMQGGIDSISQGLAGVIVDGEDLLSTVRNVAKGVAKEIISMLIKIGVQRVATALLSTGAASTEASAEAAKAVGLSFANTLASWAGAPWPISLGAPAAAAANASLAASGFAAGAATGAGLGAAIGIAHSGMTNVPATGSYILKNDERVLSPEQNKDFTEFMRGGGNGGRISIDSLTIHVLENATSIESLLAMDPKDIKDLVADKLIAALDELSDDGIRPKYVGAA